MKKTSVELQAELESIIEWFESEEVDIDIAADKYKNGLEIAKELQERLVISKNVIKKLKQSFSDT